MFTWYASGNYSLTGLTQKMKEEGFSSRKSNAKIQKSSIHKILRNPIYFGCFRWKDKLYQGNHEPIVSKELWEKVQEVLSGKAAYIGGSGKRHFAFTGLLSCGHCGCALTAEIKKGKYIYYHCTGWKGKCNEPYVSEENLGELFRELLKQIRLNDGVAEWVKEALKNSHQDEKRYHEDMITDLSIRYKKFQSRLDSMYEDKLDGVISEEFWLEKSEAYRKEQSNILEKIKVHQQANKNYLDTGIKILELSQKAYLLYSQQPPEEKRRLLKLVLSNCHFREGRLFPKWRKPFNLLASANLDGDEVKVGTRYEITENKNWLRG